MEELRVLQEKLDIAWNHFNYADKEHIEQAISELNTALNNLNEMRVKKGLPLIEI